MVDMTYWCESCARKNNCYTIRSRPKCFTPITNTAQGTPESYLAKALRYSRDSHEIAKDDPQFDKDINVRSKNEPQTYITEDRTQMLDRWQTHNRNTTSAVTPCSNCQEFDCYGCEYKQTERSE